MPSRSEEKQEHMYLLIHIWVLKLLIYISRKCHHVLKKKSTQEHTHLLIRPELLVVTHTQTWLSQALPGWLKLEQQYSQTNSP